jgi:hypothetical protein
MHPPDGANHSLRTMIRILVLFCNTLLFAFACFVLLTEGFPGAAIYIVLSLLLVLVPVFTTLAVSLRKPGGSPGRPVKRVVAACNIVLLVLVCWALVDQYPHPKEHGVTEFAVLALLTPILNAVVLLRSRGEVRTTVGERDT